MAILLLAIFGPGAAAVIITRYLDYKLRNRPSWIETFSFDHRSLFKQPWFWLVSFSGLFYTLVFMGIAVFDRKVLLTASGFETFIKDASLSLGILSAFSLLLILITRIHSSYQSEIQINESKKKNDADLFLLYKNDFTNEANDFLKMLTSDDQILVRGAKISSKFFKESRNYNIHTGAFSVNQSYLENCLESLVEMARLITSITRTSDEITLLEDMSDLNNTEELLYRKLGLDRFLNSSEHDEKLVKYKNENGFEITTSIFYESEKISKSWMLLYSLYEELLELGPNIESELEDELDKYHLSIIINRNNHRNNDIKAKSIFRKYSIHS